MAAVSAQQAADTWARNLGASTEKIKRGVQAVQQSPTEKAANRADAYVQGVQRAVSDGRYQAGLRRVSLTDWQQATITKGVARIAGGAEAAKGKFAAFMSDFLPFVENARQSLPPRGDLEQNLNRANMMARALAGYRRRVSA